MTKAEIKEYINSKIVGQGNQVDISGVLPTILEEIIDASVSPKVIELGEVDFKGSRSTFLPEEKRNNVWNTLFGHDVPDELQDIERDIMSLDTPTFVSPFRAINFDVIGESRVFYGWTFNSDIDITVDSCSIYLNDPLGEIHRLIIVDM